MGCKHPSHDHYRVLNFPGYGVARQEGLGLDAEELFVGEKGRAGYFHV